MNPVITLSDVALSFRGFALFSHVNLRIEPGGGYAIQGPNGSGKSALLRLMSRIMKPRSGTVEIDDEYLDPRAHFPAEFGIAIDGPAYVPHISGLNNLRELARIRRVIDDDDIRSTMASFGLDPLSRTRVSKYSLGMKQKLSLSQAFMENPRVLILDEPFNALDSSSAASLHERLQSFRAQGGTLVLTSHDEHHLEGIVDTKLEFDDGSLHEVS